MRKFLLAPTAVISTPYLAVVLQRVEKIPSGTGIKTSRAVNGEPGYLVWFLCMESGVREAVCDNGVAEVMACGELSENLAWIGADHLEEDLQDSNGEFQIVAEANLESLYWFVQNVDSTKIKVKDVIEALAKLDQDASIEVLNSDGLTATEVAPGCQINFD